MTAGAAATPAAADAPLARDAGTPALGARVAHGAAWLGTSYALTRLLGAATSVVLARLLTPAEFGVVAMANLALAFVGPLQDSGLEQALVAERGDVRRAAATVAWMTPFTGLALALAVAAAAPLVAALFHDPGVTPVLRLLGLTFLVRGLAVAPLGILTREMAFRARAAIALSGAVAEAAVGIALAALGWGVLALVAGQLAAVTVAAAAAWWLVPWRPRGRFEPARLVALSRFGRHMVAGNVLGFLGSYLDNVAVGRRLGSDALGVYGVAFRWGQLPAQALAATVHQVAFPSYVALADDRARAQAAYLRVVRTITTLALPACAGLALVAPRLVHALYAPAWDGMIGPLRVFCAFAAVNALVATTGDVFKAAHRTRWISGLALVHLPVLAVMLWLLVDRGPIGAATALLVAALASGSVAVPAALRILGLAPRRLAAALLPQTFAAAVMGAALVAAGPWLDRLPALAGLAVAVVLGTVLYGAAAGIVARDAVDDLVVAGRTVLRRAA